MIMINVMIVIIINVIIGIVAQNLLNALAEGRFCGIAVSARAWFSENAGFIRTVASILSISNKIALTVMATNDRKMWAESTTGKSYISNILQTMDDVQHT
jgi:hypothetical protein